jgi:PAS domain S-box-containing protein
MTNISDLEAVLSEAMEAVPAGFVVYDAEGRLVVCNAMFREFYGYSEKDAAPGATRFELGEIDQQGGVKVAGDTNENYFESRSRYRLSFGDEQVLQLPDGRLISTRDKPISSGGFVSIQIDITELAEARTRLEENEQLLLEAIEKLEINNRTKDRFFSIISHDLQSPFTALLGMTEVMSKHADQLSREKLIEYGTDVNKAGQQVFNLLQNLLQWSRLQMDGAEYGMETISLGNVVELSLATLNPLARTKNITLTNRVENLQAFAHTDMVQTVLRNIVGNALKFTPTGGSVELSSRLKDDQVEISVTDSGVGMTGEQAAQVFSLDQKFSSDGTEGEKGTGLGLPLCKELLETMKGEIRVESEPGQGATFYITLPRKSGDE